MENTMPLKKIIAAGLLLIIFLAGTYVSAGEQHHKDFDSGPNSPFVKSDHFPRDYFLIPYNLPHFLGLIMHHGGADTLKLSTAQKEALFKQQKKILPSIMQKAKEIKKMEVEIARSLVEGKGNMDTMFPLVDNIAKAKTELTKMHLRCLDQVRMELSKEQYQKLIQIAGNQGNP
jgi:hypothetical protein